MKAHSFCKHILAISFILTICQTMQAQDAFYIYRNDGDFDGFFYDQVKRIGYSKTDLEGNEHDVFVVQEVETLDSLYRIPLAAIDSVGFVQPEIIPDIGDRLVCLHLLIRRIGENALLRHRGIP